MNKNVQAILIVTAALLIVSFMYIGGLISDANRDKANEKKEQPKVQSKETPEYSSNTNLLIKDKEIKITPSAEEIHEDIKEQEPGDIVEPKDDIEKDEPEVKEEPEVALTIF